MTAQRPALLHRFRRDERGNVAMIFGLSLLPILFVTGAAIDYSRGASERERLIQALDATGLALAHDAKTMPDAAFNAKANQVFSAMYRSNIIGAAPTVTTSRANERLTVSVAANVPTAMMHLAGFPNMPIHAAASVNYATKKLEIALVLDNTGSMAGQGKMAALKVAATNFVNQLAATSPAAGDIRVSMIPFATQVRVSPTQAGQPWLQMNGLTSATWSGCIADRDMNWDVTANPGAFYPAVNCAAPGMTQLMGLTDLSVGADRTALVNRINAMSPGGNTNLTVGLAWGLSSLTPNSQLPGAAAFNQAHVEKFVVLLTDGDNTQNRFTSAGWAIDERTRMACDEIKQPAKKIRVFSIRVIAGNQALLRNCASNNTYYFEASDASQIQPAFDAILRTIASIHLAS